MTHILSIVITAFVASSVVAAEDLLSCGDSNYYPSQYTCFDDDFLCPIINGTICIQCGNACYTNTQYSCSNGVLEQFNPNGPETPEMCGVDQYDPSQYVCLDSGFLCPIIDGNITLKCDDTCYAPAQYG
ncbi:carbohydrate binding-domain-containing protein [Mycena galopus ATCC 62051]|nr:carbohydrate binding-domain-containing protein [Mycena galopus ATCC 62051]